jgi:RNA polymerase sigma factor (sigma-70 family)
MKKETTDTANGSKTKVLIVDDHAVVVEGIHRALQDEPDFEIVGTASDGLQAVQQVLSLEPDIVIMDVSMPNLNGIEATHEIKTFKEPIHVLIYSMYSDKEYILSLFRLGISGYVLKGEPIEDLIRAIKSVSSGATYYSQSVQEIIRDHMEDLELGGGAIAREIQDGLIKLSVREKEVFVLLADGLTPREIAKRLGISPKTAETHKYNIMEKLEVSSVAQLTKIAIKKDLIEI